ncbi:MAG: hypothetical protein E7168_01810 [Firmicutes bacterium]|nr:hypothetical protein [Bacillota bacterium]
MKMWKIVVTFALVAVAIFAVVYKMFLQPKPFLDLGDIESIEISRIKEVTGDKEIYSINRVQNRNTLEYYIFRTNDSNYLTIELTNDEVREVLDIFMKYPIEQWSKTAPLGNISDLEYYIEIKMYDKANILIGGEDLADRSQDFINYENEMFVHLEKLLIKED